MPLGAALRGGRPLTLRLAGRTCCAAPSQAERLSARTILAGPKRLPARANPIPNPNPNPDFFGLLRRGDDKGNGYNDETWDSWGRGIDPVRDIKNPDHRVKVLFSNHPLLETDGVHRPFWVHSVAEVAAWLLQVNIPKPNVSQRQLEVALEAEHVRIYGADHNYRDDDRDVDSEGDEPGVGGFAARDCAKELAAGAQPRPAPRPSAPPQRPAPALRMP